METTIRMVKDRDWPAVTSEFNHFVTESFAAYPAEPVSEDFFNKRRPDSPDFPFHTRRGFTECGRFLKVGQKAGREFDMVWMQRIED